MIEIMDTQSGISDEASGRVVRDDKMVKPQPDPKRNDGDSRGMDVVFSLEDGFVWAGWAGEITMIRLGRQDRVVAMMRDFLNQTELGERLLNGKSSVHHPGTDRAVRVAKREGPRKA